LYTYIYQNKLCRNSNHDETNFDSTPAPSDITLNKTVETLPVNNITSSTGGLNGEANNNAYSSNQAIDAPSHIHTESQLVEEFTMSAENTDSSQLQDTNTSTTEVLPASDSLDNEMYPSLNTAPPVAAPTDSLINNAIDSALDDNAATSTVPPVVEARESDLRNSTPLPPAPESSAEEPLIQEAASVNLGIETELSVPQTAQPVEPTATADTANTTLDNSATDHPLAPADDQPPQQTATSIPIKSEPVPSADPAMQLDTEMSDAGPSSKVDRARQREDDDETEPSAKRTKMEHDETMASPDDVALQATQNGESAALSEVVPISPYQSKEIIKILKAVAKTKDGKNFRAPVRTLWPNFADQYAAKIPNEIDLATMETKVREGKYAAMSDFKADVQLLYDNALTFNGDPHLVTKAADAVRQAILEKASKVSLEPPAPAKPVKKQPRSSTPDSATRTTAARRPSRSAGTSSANAKPAPTFALDPTTSTPLIRRDSTKADNGRPKREIHPPKNKELAYHSVRPKNKKFAVELKFCQEVLNELKKPKHLPITSAFLIPVDPVALNIPNYFTVIKNPMDISTVEKKLSHGDYTRAKEFESDIKLIVKNCKLFNPAGNPVHVMGTQLDRLFEQEWAKKDQYISEHTPAAFSPSESAGSEEEESEDEDEADEPAANPGGATAFATQRLIEEQNKLIDLLAGKNVDHNAVEMQKDMIAYLKSKIEKENASAAGPKKPSKKAKAAKPVKKAAPTKKGSVPAPKKAANNRHNRYMGTLEKEVISMGLGELPDDVSGTVLEMLKKDQPGVDVSLPHSFK